MGRVGADDDRRAGQNERLSRVRVPQRRGISAYIAGLGGKRLVDEFCRITPLECRAIARARSGRYSVLYPLSSQAARTCRERALSARYR